MRGRNEQTFALADVDGQIPLHPRCRCTIVAASWKDQTSDRGARASSEEPSIRTERERELAGSGDDAPEAARAPKALT